MSPDPRRLVRRVLLPGFAGTEAPDWLHQEAASGLAGVCLFGHNVASVQQVRALTDDLHACGSLLVASDEEGGIVSRLGTIAGSRHVGAAALGMAGDTTLTRGVAAAIGQDLRAAGIDLNLGPVADVSSNPDNPVIGVRAFGTEPAAVAAHVRAYVEGLHSAGILACAKHFPGHGDTAVDSHLGLPRIDADLATLRTRDLVPFVAAVETGVDAVMTAHIIFSALDSEPATGSAAVLRFLRDELGFVGVITSDAMDMRAVADTVGLAEGCVRALIAGVDLLGLGNPVLSRTDRDDEGIYREAFEAILAAVDNGRLSLDRLRDAAGRVDSLAAHADALRTAPAHPILVADADAHAAAAALRTTGQVRGRFAEAITVVDIRRRRNIASGRPAGLLAEALSARLPGSRLMTAFVLSDWAEGRAGGQIAAVELPARADVVITASPWLDEAEAHALRTLLAADPSTVVVCTGWAPEHALLAPAEHTVRAFGDDLPTAAAVAALLTARS